MLGPLFGSLEHGVGHEKLRDIRALLGNLKEGECGGLPFLWPRHFTIEVFPVLACCLLECWVDPGTLLPGEEGVGGSVSRETLESDGVLVPLMLGWAWT